MVLFVNNSPPKLALGDNVYNDEVFTAAGANTYPAGTILAQLDASPQKYVVYVVSGSNGIGVPRAILRNLLVTTGSGDTPIRPMIAGKFLRTSVTAYNGGTPLAVTNLEVTELRDFGLVAQDSTELNNFDNTT
jgi:hypothetical protein